MARNDGIDRTVARNQDLPTPDDVAKIQEHNEREKDSYSNQDIVPERTPLNVHFKTPTDDYVKMFEQMEQDGVISTRGLKPDAIKYGELVFDVNSAYFYNYGDEAVYSALGKAKHEGNIRLSDDKDDRHRNPVRILDTIASASSCQGAHQRRGTV